MLSDIELLKIKLFCQGANITKRANFFLSEGGNVPLTLMEYATTSGIPFKFQNDVYVNIPFVESFTKNSELTLDFDGNKCFIYLNKKKFYGEPIPFPAYINKKNRNGENYSWFAMTHTDRVRVSPIAGCSYSCKFCDSPQTHTYQKKSIPELIESINVAIEDPVLPAKHCLISGGTPKPEDFGYIDDVYKNVGQDVDIPVDVMMPAYRDINYIEQLYSWGIDGLSINIEFFNYKCAKKFCPEKAELIPEKSIKFLEKAVDIFGVGKVRSAILVGLEPIKETLKGVEQLAKIGCDPMLSPFRPSPNTSLRNYPSPSEENLIEVYEKSIEIVKKYGVKLGSRCIPCHHNTLTFTDGSNDYYFS